MPKQVLTIRADEDVIEMLEAIAERTGQSRSVVAERALRAGLEQSADTIEFISRPGVRQTLGRFLASPKFQEVVAELAGVQEDKAEVQRRAAAFGNVIQKAGKGGRKLRKNKEGGSGSKA
jgi:predicted transcriptional regulator